MSKGALFGIIEIAKGDFDMKFDENLRNLRKDKDFSQEYLAEKMNVSRQTISKWENGTAMPDLKKLTELAEFFDTSMDELLGTSAPVYNSVNNDLADNTAEQLSAIKKQFDEYKSKNKKGITIISILLIISFVALIITNVEYRDLVQNLQGQINDISHNTQIIYRDDNNESSILDDLEYYITAVDKKNPSVIELSFNYTPKSYVKGTIVSFAITDLLSSKMPPDAIEAELSGKSFCAILTIDTAHYYTIDISVDDGTNITTEKLDIDFARLYYGFDNTGVYYSKSFTRQDNIENEKTTVTSNISFDFGNEFVYYYREGLPNIINAYIEAENNSGEIIYTNELKLETNSDKTNVIFNDFSVHDDVSNVYIKLLDDYGTTTKIECIDMFPDENENSSENIEQASIRIEFSDGRILNSTEE